MAKFCRESAAISGQRWTPSWSYEGEERKEEIGREKWGRGRGAEYERKDEERVKWLFIGISEVGAVEVLLLKLHQISFNSLARPTLSTTYV